MAEKHAAGGAGCAAAGMMERLGAPLGAAALPVAHARSHRRGAAAGMMERLGAPLGANE